MKEPWFHDGWYYHREETILGPLTFRELQDLRTRGILGAEHIIWKGWRRPGDSLLLPVRLDRLVLCKDESSMQEKPV